MTAHELRDELAKFGDAPVTVTIEFPYDTHGYSSSIEDILVCERPDGHVALTVFSEGAPRALVDVLASKTRREILEDYESEGAPRALAEEES